MLDALEMPDALSGVRIEREERVGELVVAVTVCAVEIGRGGSGGDENEPTFHVDRHARQLLAPPVYFQAFFGHVLWPYSPGRGMEWNVHRSRPVRTS